MLAAVSDGQEYRISELAHAASIPVRTLRYYQERRLLPPPRRQGRVGWYSEEHLARLRVIADLLERGHTLEGIRELLSAWEEGRDVAELLGLEQVVTAPWSNETPVTMTLAEMEELFPGEITPEITEQAIALGHVEVDGDRITHWSRRQLDATVALVRAGVPLSEVLAASRELQRGVDELAAMFVRMITTHVVGRLGDRHPAEPAEPGEATGPAGSDEPDLAALSETLAELRPGAQLAVEASFARAMDRRVRIEIDNVLGQLAASRDHPRAG